MGLIEFLKNKLIGRESYEISGKTFEEFLQSDTAYSKFHLTEIALFTAVDLIARTLAKCEFVTVENHKEVQKAEYYLWNYAPNKHQTKTEFIIEAVAKLILQNELLIFETSDGQLLCADNFARTERAVLEDTFSNIYARGMTFQYTLRSSDVIYLRYNNSSIKQLFIPGMIFENLEVAIKLNEEEPPSLCLAFYLIQSIVKDIEKQIKNPVNWLILIFLFYMIFEVFRGQAFGNNQSVLATDVKGFIYLLLILH